jgi:PleD family two-component response regulator
MLPIVAYDKSKHSRWPQAFREPRSRLRMARSLTLRRRRPPSTQSDGRAPESTPVSPRRILLVDDNRDVLFSLKLLLETEGHTVLKALDG